MLPEVNRLFDPEIMRKATSDYRDMVPEDIIDGWVNNHNNYMYVSGDNVGLATLEYPGLYSLHWYFKSARGRQAINLARTMMDCLFKDSPAQAIRGLVKDVLKASRWGARQAGLTSMGFVKYPDYSGEYELFCMTKEDFYKEKQNG